MTNSFKSLYVKSLFFFLIISSCSERREAEISKIEHIYIRTKNAQGQFIFFTEFLKLPIVWDYENYGDFTSGGISLGNLVLELIDANHSEQPHPFGIALRPIPDLNSVILSLDTIEIRYGNIQQASHWDLLALEGLLSKEINLFICDYKDWDAVEKERAEAAKTLRTSNGGPIEIQGVKQVLVNQKQFQSTFEKLPGVVGLSSTTRFNKGPEILWEDSSTHALGLMIRVNSLENAKVFLDQHDISYQLSKRGLEILDKQFELGIILMEN